MAQGLLKEATFNLLSFPPQDSLRHLIDRDDSAVEIDRDQAIGHRGEDIVLIGFQRGDLPEAFFELCALEADLLDHVVEVVAELFNLIAGTNIDGEIEVPLGCRDGRVYQFRDGTGNTPCKKNRSQNAEENGQTPKQEKIQTGPVKSAHASFRGRDRCERFPIFLPIL